jgi:peptidoglycan/LPS O-acetylase OafA/YrhL
MISYMVGRTLSASVAHVPPVSLREHIVPAPSGSARVGELDGIRSIAIWMVLFMHGLATESAIRAASAFHGWQAILWLTVAHGWLGVDLFFVLSGFLITGILLDTKNRSNYFKSFYVRRALRILPVFLVVLGILALIYRGPAAYFGLALLFCANLAPLLGVGTPPGGGPLWSLAVEEQFYLFWPALLRFVSVRALTIVATIIVLVEPLVRFEFGQPDTISFTWMRCDGLALGALVAIWVRAPRCNRTTSFRVAIAALGLSLALGLLELVMHSTIFSVALRISEANLVFGAIVLSAYTLRGSRWTAWLRSPPAIFFAGVSYCAYVIHLPIFNLVDALGLTRASTPFEAGVLRMLYSFPLVFVIATLSKRYLEEPFLRLKGVLSRS